MIFKYLLQKAPYLKTDTQISVSIVTHLQYVKRMTNQFEIHYNAVFNSAFINSMRIWWAYQIECHI